VIHVGEQEPDVGDVVCRLVELVCVGATKLDVRKALALSIGASELDDVGVVVDRDDGAEQPDSVGELAADVPAATSEVEAARAYPDADAVEKGFAARFAHAGENIQALLS
jgi:hypothetical protein